MIHKVYHITASFGNSTQNFYAYDLTGAMAGIEFSISHGANSVSMRVEIIEQKCDAKTG